MKCTLMVFFIQKLDNYTLIGVKIYYKVNVNVFRQRVKR